MEGAYRDKYSFIGEWYDNQASLVRRFNVFYYPVDDTIEMYDLRNRKTFVRRVKVNGINLDSFYIGCTLYILGRLIKIVDFACEDTRKLLHKDIQATFAMIKPLPTNIAGKIFTHLHENGLRVTKLKKCRLTTEDINILYRSLLGDATFPFLLEHLNGQLVYGMELVGKDAVSHCLKVLGNRDPHKAESGTIRALYGTDRVKNCVHAASNPDAALEDLEYFFPPPPLHAVRLRLTATLSNCTLCIVKPHAVLEGKLGTALEIIDVLHLSKNAYVLIPFDFFKQDLEYFFPPPPLRAVRLRLTATLSNCTLCIVKPHAVLEGKLGTALEIIDEGGFEVTALNMFMVENDNAAEFYEVYKGIVPEYKGMVEELSSGPCIAMEIVSKDKSLNTAVEFRKLVGPADPEIARLLRPHTLRAKLGNTKVQNAIHCSDLDVDGLLEVEYFFKILDL